MSDASQRFSGFPAGRLAFTPLPTAFFTHVLPAIDDLAELKVTLHLFWQLHRKKGNVRCAHWEELLADRTLATSLVGHGGTWEEALAQALERAVARGTVLHVAVASDTGVDSLYFLNTDEGRQAAEKVRRGEATLVLPRRRPRPAGPPGAGRSAIVSLYEQQISLLTATVAAELQAAEQEYGAENLVDAIAEAVHHDKRHWAYIKRVLANGQRRAGGEPDNG